MERCKENSSFQRLCFHIMRLKDGMIKSELSAYVTTYDFMHKPRSREKVEQDIRQHSPLVLSGGCLVETRNPYHTRRRMRLADMNRWIPSHCWREVEQKGAVER